MTEKTPKIETTKATKADYVKSIAWLIEATFRGFVGYMLAVHFRSSYVALAAAIYALVTAGIIVIAHFVKAHK